MHWIIPNKILAHSSPVESEKVEEKSFLSLIDYAIVFKHFKIKCIIRLNEKQYDEKYLIS